MHSSFAHAYPLPASHRQLLFIIRAYYWHSSAHVLLNSVALLGRTTRFIIVVTEVTCENRAQIYSDNQG